MLRASVKYYSSISPLSNNSWNTLASIILKLISEGLHGIGVGGSIGVVGLQQTVGFSLITTGSIPRGSVVSNAGNGRSKIPGISGIGSCLPGNVSFASSILEHVGGVSWGYIRDRVS